MRNTGKPHIDKPWEKYYSTKKIDSVDIDMNMVDYLRMKHKDNLDIVVETYYGREFTLREILKDSDNAARVLSFLGVKKGEVIANLLPNIPEAAQIWFGATELGAITDFIDPRPDGMDENINSKKIMETLREEKIKYIITSDFSYLQMIKPIEKELKEMGIEHIVIINLSDSMIKAQKPDYLNVLRETNRKQTVGQTDYLRDVIQYNELANSRKSNKERISSLKALSQELKRQKVLQQALEMSVNSSPLKVMRYENLLEQCQSVKYTKISDGNLVNYIGHTSGTSGSKPKPILHTNKSAIALAEQCEIAEFSPLRGETSFHLLPFFAPAGAYSNYFINLSTGAKTIDVAEFHLGDFGYLIKKYQPNYILATPSWLNLLVDYRILNKEELEYIKKVIYVGDSMSTDDIKKFQNWLIEHGSTAILESAHGLSEIGGCGSYAHGEYNKPGSVGIPLPETVYSLVEPEIEDKLVPIKFEKGKSIIEGELVISAPNLTIGNLWDKVIVPKYQMDGLTFMRTGDLSKMDKDGVFYQEARKDRSFMRIDGYKVKPFGIEKIIESNKNVKYARIVPYYDERKNGTMPLCHIVLNDNCIGLEPIEIVKDIVYNTIIGNPGMSSRQIPSKFKFRVSLPLTKNNKVDFVSLTKEPLDGSEVNVDIEETNLSVGNIEIYENGKRLYLK